jgi:fatty acid desaturase
VGAIGTLFWQPPSLLAYALDVLVRSYLVFLGTVMAHEAVHGHLGRSRGANMWWGRVALLSSMVPFTNFRKTHRLHHAHTNDPERDPDYFLKSRTALDTVLRALAMPHHWLFWLRARGMLSRDDRIELLFNYLGIACVFGAVGYVVGPVRLAAGMLPTFVIVSLLLWYPFAVKTHERYSTGSEASRSHNYYGSFMYWFSLGLSMHREHHLKPWLSWVELRRLVESPPGLGKKRWLPQRDIVDGGRQGVEETRYALRERSEPRLGPNGSSRFEDRLLVRRRSDRAWPIPEATTSKRH